MVERVTRRGLNFLLVMFVVFSALLLLTVLPFFAYVFFGAFAAFLVWPLHARMRRHVPRYLSAWGLVALVYATIFVPLVLIFLSIFRDLARAIRLLAREDTDAASYIRGFLEEILPEAQAEQATEWLVGALRDLLLRIASEAIGRSMEMLLGFFIFGFILFYTLLHGDMVKRFVREIIPLRDVRVDGIFLQIRLSLNAVFYGVIFVALIQSVAGGIVWWIAGLPNPFFYGAVMFVLSIIPFAGPSFILIPAGIFRIFQGDVGWGVFLILSGVIFVGSIDNFLRPVMVSRFGNINPAMVVVGLAGGIVAFGIVGIVLGPLIFALWVGVAKELRFEIQQWKLTAFPELTPQQEEKERREHEEFIRATAEPITADPAKGAVAGGGEAEEDPDGDGGDEGRRGNGGRSP